MPELFVWPENFLWGTYGVFEILKTFEISMPKMGSGYRNFSSKTLFVSASNLSDGDSLFNYALIEKPTGSKLINFAFWKLLPSRMINYKFFCYL